MLNINLQQTREKKSIIGLLGGAGPEACIDVQRKIIDVVQKKNTTLSDQDHYHVVTDNNTSLINRDKQFYLTSENLLIQQYRKTLGFFEALEVSVAAITCNAAHVYFKEIQNLTTIKLVNIIDCVVQHLKDQKITKIGLLSSFSTYQSALYNNVLQNHNIQIFIPSELDQIKMALVVYAIKAGLFDIKKDLSSDKFSKLLSVYNHNLYKLIPMTKYESLASLQPDILLQQVILNLQKKGVQFFVLGCTELPIINSWYDNLGIEYIDANMLLAQELVAQCEKKTKSS